jgi:hypothetical protein
MKHVKHIFKTQETYGARCHGVVKKFGSALNCQRSTVKEQQTTHADASPAPLKNFERQSFSLWSQHMHGPMRIVCTPRPSKWPHALPCISLCHMQPTPRTSGYTCFNALSRRKDRCRPRLTATARSSFFLGRRARGVGPSRQTDALNPALPYYIVINLSPCLKESRTHHTRDMKTIYPNERWPCEKEKMV